MEKYKSLDKPNKKQIGPRGDDLNSLPNRSLSKNVN